MTGALHAQPRARMQMVLAGPRAQHRVSRPSFVVRTAVCALEQRPMKRGIRP